MYNLDLHQPHDAIAKECLSNKALARDFLEAHLPENIKELCNFETLNMESGSYVDEELQKYCSDILYSVQLNGELAYIYCLIEHQSEAVKLMPFRILSYQVSIMRRHLDQGFEKLPLVVPLVLYHGKRKPYPYSIELADCFAHPDLARNILLKGMSLIDLTVMPENEIMSHKRAALLEMLQKHIFVANIMEHIESIKAVLNLVRNYPDLQSSLSPVIYYLYKEANTSNRSDFIDTLTKNSSPYQESAMTAAEYLIAEGIERGIQRGVEQGMQQGIEQGMQQGIEQGMQQGYYEAQLKIAYKLEQKSMDRAFIEKITGIDLAKIK